LNLNEMTEETLAQFRKAQQTGFNVANGVTGYDLSPLLQLIPVNTPLFSSITRKVAPVGSAAAYWKILTNLSASMPNPFSGLSAGGALIPTNVLNMSAQYVPVRISDQLDLDARDLSRGYEDLAALATAYTLSNWRVLEEKALFGGQAVALPAIGTIVGTPVASGGTLPAAASFISVQARSGFNYYWGGSGIMGTPVSVTTVSGGSITATVPFVTGAVAYDWFIGSSNSNGVYAGTSVTNTFTFTTLTAATAPPVLPDLFTGVPTKAASDGSFSANAYNGLLASTLLDYGNGTLVTTGTGTSSGATFQSLNGAKLSTANGQSIAELDNLFQGIYQNSQQIPNRILVSGQQGQDIKNRILGPQSTLLELSGDGSGRTGIVAGGSVAKYIAFTGDQVDVQVSPHCPPGTIVAISDRVNFPDSGIANVLESRVQRDVQEWDYGVQLSQSPGGGPRKVWDVSSIETFINRAPLAMGVISNIQAG
jgi:hypothetical protein